jgi:hypothetical protein
MMDWSESSIFSMFLEGCVRTRRVHREIKENLDATNVSTPNCALQRQRRTGVREGAPFGKPAIVEADLAEVQQFAE